MNVSTSIENRIREALQPEHLELQNESHMHAGPATDSHFKLVIVAGGFDGLNRVKRHQLVYRILADELQSGGSGTVHALALHLYSPLEWEAASVPDSPRCAGKNK